MLTKMIFIIAVKKLINNHDLCKRFSDNLAKENFDKKHEMKKIYKLSQIRI